MLKFGLNKLQIQFNPILQQGFMPIRGERL